LFPPLSDILKCKKDLEQGATPKDVSKAVREYYQWPEEPAIATKGYIKTFLA